MPQLLQQPNLESAIAAFDRQDYAQAWDLVMPFALYGQAQAQWMVGRMYQFGLGAAVDIPEAIAWYRQASHQGHSAASDQLAKLLVQGDATVPEIDLASRPLLV